MTDKLVDFSPSLLPPVHLVELVSDWSSRHSPGLLLRELSSSAVQCNTVQCSVVQFSAVHYSAKELYCIQWTRGMIAQSIPDSRRDRSHPGAGDTVYLR